MATEQEGAEFNPNAFPTDPYNLDKHKGMTLRDWFAGQALAMSQPDGPENLAEWSYRVADAMLNARRAAIARATGEA